jgi:hypothetical protein
MIIKNSTELSQFVIFTNCTFTADSVQLDVHSRYFCVCIVACRQKPYDVLIPVYGVLPDV